VAEIAERAAAYRVGDDKQGCGRQVDEHRRKGAGQSPHCLQAVGVPGARNLLSTACQASGLVDVAVHEDGLSLIPVLGDQRLGGRRSRQEIEHPPSMVGKEARTAVTEVPSWGIRASVVRRARSKVGPTSRPMPAATRNVYMSRSPERLLSSPRDQDACGSHSAR
jgi:hypothetical protein